MKLKEFFTDADSKLEENFKDLMEKTLTPNPLERLDMKGVLEHPFFN